MSYLQQLLEGPSLLSTHREVDGRCIGLIRGGTDLTGRALRLVQTGNLQTYAFLFVLGVAVVLWLVLGK